MRSRIAALIVGSLLAAAPLHAQTHFTFKDAGSYANNTGAGNGGLAWGFYVGNYHAYEGPASQGSSRQTVTINCVDFYHSISVGQEWDANLTNLAGTGQNMALTRFGNLNLYREAAILTDQFNSVTSLADQSVIQETIWHLFNSSPVLNSAGISGAGHSESYWKSYAVSHLASFDYTGYYVVTDVLGANGGTGGVQEFIMHNPNQQSQTTTPEPASFILFGTGLAGLAIVRRRKRNKTS
jgi:hypothetical protein